MKVIRLTNKDVLKFQEDIKSVFCAKSVAMERLLTFTKQLCQDSRIIAETAAKQGDKYRKCATDPTQKIIDVKSQRSSVKELRQMATFIDEKDVPIGKTDTTHFERFALFAELELQKALGVIKEADQTYISVLEYFGEDTKTPAADFFGVICQFIDAFDLASVLVEREEEMKLKEARRALAKEAKLRVKRIARVLKQTEGEGGTTGSKQPPSSVNHPMPVRESHEAGSKEELVNTRTFTVDERFSSTGSAKHENMSTDASYSAQNGNEEPSSGSIVAIVAAAARKNARKKTLVGCVSMESRQHPVAGSLVAMAAADEMSQISVDDSPLSSTAPSVGGIMNIASLAVAAAQMIEKQRQSEGGVIFPRPN